MHNQLQGNTSINSNRKLIRFHERFKGKIQMMNKEGHFGVAKTACKPIEKVHPDVELDMNFN